MKTIRNVFLVCAVLLTAGFSLFADGEIKILATNSWTAAFVDMAGGEAEQLAPADMVHPPEYELKPSDVRKIRDADLMVFAGYEVLMKTVFSSFNKPEDELLQIMTSYAPEALEKSVLAIAGKIGTLPAARSNIREYKRQIEEARADLRNRGLFGAPVLVHFHQQPLARALGFQVLGVFGPQPLEAKQIAELGDTEPALIIDNAHNPMAAPLAEITGAPVVKLINFPAFPLPGGSSAPATLGGVAAYNVERLLER